jgi:cystathionine beta-lyase
VCYCPNQALRKRFYGFLDGYEIANGNIFAYVGAEAAFRQGEDWLRQMLQYVQSNVGFLRQFLTERMPFVKAILPEASFLPWLDFNELGLTHEELKERLLDRAKVALNDGTTFGGKAYEGCFRLNIGTPRKVLQEAVERIASAMCN